MRIIKKILLGFIIIIFAGFLWLYFHREPGLSIASTLKYTFYKSQIKSVLPLSDDFSLAEKIIKLTSFVDPEIDEEITRSKLDRLSSRIKAAIGNEGNGTQVVNKFNSVLLIPETKFTDVIREQLQRDKHYIQIKSDLTDLAETVNYLNNTESGKKKCQEIIKNLSELSKKINNYDFYMNLMFEKIEKIQNKNKEIKINIHKSLKNLIWEENTQLYGHQKIFSSWNNMAFMLILVSVFVLLFQHTKAHEFLNGLSPMGRMSLSNYILQTLMGAFIYYGIGFGLYRYTGATYSFLIGIVLATIQIYFSKWWMNKHKRGPLETIWHKLTWIGSKTIK